MNVTLIALYLTTVFAFCALTYILTERLPRTVAVGSFFMVISVICITTFFGVSILGHPQTFRPWFPKESQVLKYTLAEGNGIYLWLRVSGSLEPVYIKLPWNQSAAQQLVDSDRLVLGGQASGTAMRAPDYGEDPRVPMFYPEPVQPLPPKVTQ